MANCSATPLAKKLGITTESSVVLLAAPEGFVETLVPLPQAVQLSHALELPGDADVIVLFCRSRNDLLGHLQETAAKLSPAGGLWLAWPKKASGVSTDLDFAVVQRAGLDLGLVDNKSCSINDVFSGLRFVVRRENRQAWATGQRISER